MKHISRLSFALLATSFLMSPAAASKADKVIVNAAVYTVNTAQPWAEAVAIKNGKITFVGSKKDAENHIDDNTQVIDLQGQFLLPGFQDAHIHPMEGASLETFFGCRLEEYRRIKPNPEDWIDYIRACKNQKRPINWVLGGGHNLRDLANLDRMPKELLDEALPDTPVALMEKSSHSMWVNSKALELTGITSDTPNPQGGIIIKDVKTGEPNGIVTDSAGDELVHKALAATPALQQARYEALLLSQDMMAAEGITSATNARVYWDRGNMEHWLRAEKEGTLKQRNIMAVWAYPHMDDAYQIDKIKSMYRDDKTSKLRISQIKFYSDGTISNNSAAVLEDYTTLVHPDMHKDGGNYFTEDRLARYTTELEKVGYDMHIHALGDRAVRESLNAIEAAQKANPDIKSKRRHQLTHLALIHPDDIPRFGELGVVANFQLNYDLEETEGASADSWFSRMVGNATSEVEPVLKVAETGGKVVMSSDWDVSYMSPLVSIETFTKLNKKTRAKDDLIAFAVKAYTLNAAYVMQHDDMTGSIEVGKYADLVALDQNLFDMPIDQIRDAKVTATWVGGEKIYTATSK